MSELTELHKTVVTTPTDTEIRTERVFDADPELIWNCFADPDVLSEWLGPDGYETKVEEYDFTPGGKWRYLNIAPDGAEYVFFGEFLELDQPVSMTQTFNFIMEPQPPPSIDRMDLIPLGDGRTRLVTTTTFESQDFRDGMLQSGMETGMDEGYNKLDRILAKS